MSHRNLDDSINHPAHDAAHEPARRDALQRDVPESQRDPDSIPAASARLRTAGLVPASKFLGRLAQLDLEALGKAIHVWHRTAAGDPGAWYDAEAAVADAVERTRRYAEQDVLLRHIASLFLSRVWFREAAPGAAIRAAEPAGQYVATLAMLALLVRDGLREAQFALLYGPFLDIVPLEQLERE